MADRFLLSGDARLSPGNWSGGWSEGAKSR